MPTASCDIQRRSPRRVSLQNEDAAADHRPQRVHVAALDDAHHSAGVAQPRGRESPRFLQSLREVLPVPRAPVSRERLLAVASFRLLSPRLVLVALEILE